MTKTMVQEAFTYAGGTLGTIHVEGDGSGATNGFQFYLGAGTDTEIARFKMDDNVCSVVAYSGNASGGGSGSANGNIRVVATKSAVAICSTDNSGVSSSGLIFTLDNVGNVVMVASVTTNLYNPAVVPRNTLYSAAVQYGASTSTAFGATALSKIPVPTFDGNAKWLPKVCFAHATQYIVDGSVILNDSRRYYCIGGSWFIDDAEGNA